MRFAAVASGVLAGLLALAGCFGIGDPFLEPRPSTYDSAAAFTVEAVSTGFEYRDLTLVVNDVPYKHGPRMSSSQHFYAVEDKPRPTELIHEEDRIWLPAAGRIDVAFEHNPTRTLVKELRLIVEDRSSPPPPSLAEPGDGQRSPGLPTLNWTAVDDPSGVSYLVEIQAEPTAVDGGLDGLDPGEQERHGVEIVGLQVTEVDLAASHGLVPGLTYQWRVQAIDGLGQQSAWSPTWTFTVTG